jgi:DNA-binding SARP family transcriptional activator
LETAVEFRVLGPVEVIIDGTLLSITSARQEIVLAVLLLEANRVVSVSRLVDALWDEAPPPTAKSQVQISVSALRRALAHRERGPVIVTRPPGYLIEVPEEALDVRRFELLAGSGMTAAAEQRIFEAARELRCALDLWRGPAAMGVDSRIVQVAATRLNERRLAVLEECVELDLQLGRHRDLIGELGGLVAEHPLRERFWAQLMLALYRSGRQAEALEVYRDSREILMQELGLDPGAELQNLQEAILVNDGSLSLPGDAGRLVSLGRSGAAPVPRQLLMAPTDFVGRDEILQQVCEVLSPVDVPDGLRKVVIVVLTGRGGVGKTALALHAGHLLKDAYPDGQLFAGFGALGDQPTSPTGLLEQFLRSFGFAAALPVSVEDRAAMYRSWLADRRVLIILDDMVSTRQVAPLLPGNPHCAVIITTRKRLSGLEGARRFEIGALDERSAVDLLERVIGADRVAAEPESVRALARLSEWLPLALRIASARLVGRPHWRIGKLVRRLEDEKRRLDELDFDGVSIRTTISFSYRSLDDRGRLLFRRLGLLGPIDFASWVAAPLLEIYSPHAEELLENLVEARLVEARRTEDGTVRFQMHDLVRLCAVEQLVKSESAADRAAVARRLLGCWLSLVTEAHRREYGSVLHGTAAHWCLDPDSVDALLRDPIAWFQSERVGLAAAILQAAASCLDELCWDLAVSSGAFFQATSYIYDWQRTHEAALACVKDAGNRRGEAGVLYSLGTLALTSRPDRAARDFTVSLGLFEDLGDVRGRALALGGLASAERLSGHYDTALQQYQNALDGFRQVGDPIGEADMLNAIAQIHMDREQHDVAEELLNGALAIGQEQAARRVVARAEYAIGELCLRRGRLQQAEDAFSSALLTIRGASNDPVSHAYALAGLGITRCRQGRFAMAEADLYAALETARRSGDLLIRGQVLLGMAELDIARDQTGSAMARLDEALAVQNDIGSLPLLRARTLLMIGRVHEREGDRAAATRAWQVAAAMASDTDQALASQLAAALARLAAESRQA